MKTVISAVQNLLQHDVMDPRVVAASDELVAKIASAEAQDLSGKVNKIKVAAEIPARNYAHIAKIADDLNKAIELSNEPGNEEVRPKIAAIVAKVAGLFAEIDTMDHLAGKSLEQVESAVHSLYSNGKMNKPDTYNFAARGKGHHSKQ